MNLQVMARRLFGKSTLLTGDGTSLSMGARIYNNGSNSDITLGQHCRLEGELFIFGHGGRIRTGDWCFIGPGTRIWSARNISIGDRVLISHNVNIMDSLTHPLDPEARHAHFRSILLEGHPKEIDLDERDIQIEDDVWIGAAACIMRGVRIGCGAIVGAGSVVTADVRPGTVVAGNPAREIKEIAPNA